VYVVPDSPLSCCFISNKLFLNMLPVFRTELPPDVTMEPETWLSPVMVHGPLKAVSNRPFLTMLVANAVAVVEVVVVASVVETVTVLVMRVVSVTATDEVVVVEAVVASVDVLDEVDTTVTVVDGASTVMVSGK